MAKSKRQASEQARGQRRRKDGKFAAQGKPAPTAPLEEITDSGDTAVTVNGRQAAIPKEVAERYVAAAKSFLHMWDFEWDRVVEHITRPPKQAAQEFEHMARDSYLHNPEELGRLVEFVSAEGDVRKELWDDDLKPIEQELERIEVYQDADSKRDDPEYKIEASDKYFRIAIPLKVRQEFDACTRELLGDDAKSYGGIEGTYSEDTYYISRTATLCFGIAHSDEDIDKVLDWVDSAYNYAKALDPREIHSKFGQAMKWIKQAEQKRRELLETRAELAKW